MTLLIWGATVIDAVANEPAERRSILVEGQRISAIGDQDEVVAAPSATVIDARGKYVIPGLMNGNVHLLMDVRLESLTRYLGRYEELIIEAAQVALKNGQTAVFDTWGARRFLVSARDRINAGTVVGSRIYCAGNILGLDGPLSEDFFPNAKEVASAAFLKEVDGIWAENVGRRLMWLTPDDLAREVRSYMSLGIDFIKYASNMHYGPFLAFSFEAQAAMVEEAHRAGKTAQAHVTTVEGVRVAVQAGCDLIQHANSTGRVPLPRTTLELMAKRGTGAVVFPYAQHTLDSLMARQRSWKTPEEWDVQETNVRNIARSGAPLVLANDGCLVRPDALSDPTWGKWGFLEGLLEDDSLFSLATGHFYWLKAMEEKGCSPMTMLRAATRNVAVAYGKESDLGTIEPGKLADLVILDKDPLAAADNYRSIHAVIKDGMVIDRSALPETPTISAAQAT